MRNLYRIQKAFVVKFAYLEKKSLHHKARNDV